MIMNKIILTVKLDTSSEKDNYIQFEINSKEYMKEIRK